MQNLLTLKIDSLENYINNENYIFIDIRSSNSYNGWILNNENISGHIKGSINIYHKWINQINFKDLLNERKIYPSHNIILCHNNSIPLKNIIKLLKELSYKSIYILDMKDLTISDKKFIKSYKNFKNLLPPEFIGDLEISSNINEFKIFHVGFGAEEESSKDGHIKGSIYINTDEIEPPPLWKLGSAKVLYEFAKKYALSINDKIIITSWNQLASYRIATTLLHIGIKNVKVLNGGLSSLKEIGYKFETKSNYITPKDNFTSIINDDSDVILTTAKLKKLLLMSNFTLIDNRSWLEHIGVISGYDYYKKKSRIPGSIYGHAGTSGPHSLEYYRNPDNTMISKEIIESLWASQNINTNNILAFMCGSGWRASEVYFYAHVIGYENIYLYSDGWIGWSRDNDNPTETGIPN